MDRKKLIRLLCVLLFLLVVLIVIKSSRHGSNLILEDVSRKISDWQVEREYEKSEEYAEEKQVEGIVSEVETLLNSGDLDTIYQMTNELYLEYKFENDRTLFNQYMANFIGENITLEFQSFQRKGETYLCTVISNSDTKKTSFQLLIVPEGEEKYSLIFDNLDSITRTNFEVTNERLGIKSKIKLMATSSNSLIFVIENENITNQSLQCVYDSVKLEDTSGHSFVLSTIEGQSITVEPGEKTRETYRFSNESVLRFPKNYLTITFKGEDGTAGERILFNLGS